MHGPASAGRMGSPHSQHLLRAGLQTSADSGSQLAANNGNRTRPSSSARYAGSQCQGHRVKINSKAGGFELPTIGASTGWPVPLDTRAYMFFTDF